MIATTRNVEVIHPANGLDEDTAQLRSRLLLWPRGSEPRAQSKRYSLQGKTTLEKGPDATH